MFKFVKTILMLLTPYNLNSLFYKKVIGYASLEKPSLNCLLYPVIPMKDQMS